ncbi:hypothetical protein AMC90_CH02647 [Rhizobium phaseoli]|uniref:hypothetical protein n=1 Tax=Rhizobium phaseoli TaxID=396 RepID=UPI0007F1453C|nr:hypothetical protein [Rhizobium phaseoli]ANL28455.1 hypothetical protein AMC90_CH02647 [Rhizobium phaseoli]
MGTACIGISMGVFLADHARPFGNADDEAGLGDGIVLIPVLGEIPIVLVVYTMALLYLRPARQNPSAARSLS